MIKFMFIDINKLSKIYIHEDSIEEFLGMECQVTSENYVACSYYNNLLENFKIKNVITNYKHEGCHERIAKEVYTVLIDKTSYKVSFMFDTFELCNQLTIIIDYDKTPELDKKLEKFKFQLKQSLIKDWEKCIWLRDDQSEALASSLYNKMHFVENLIRELVNNVLIKVLGRNWIDLPEFNLVNEEYKSRYLDFKRTVENFKNIDDSLISINTDTLFKIMKTTIYDKSINFSNSLQEKSDIKKKIFENKNESILMILKKLYNKKYDLWEDFFKELFTDEIETIITDFIKNRNHIAHNKLVDSYASKKIEENIILMKQKIEKALAKISDIEMSKEHISTLEAIEEEERQEKEFWLSLKSVEAGVTIRTEQEIFTYLTDTLENFYSSIRDKFYFNSEVEFTKYKNITEKDKEFEVFRICNFIDDDDTLSVYGYLDITEGEGERSYLYLKVKRKNEVLMEGEIEYINGETMYNKEQSYFMPESDSTINTQSIDSLAEDLISFVKNDMNSLKRKVDELRYSVIKDGDSLPVADISCWNCDKEYISLDEDFYPYGTCINCGEENKLSECGRCGDIYNQDEDGDDFFCGWCKLKIEDE